MLYYLGDGEVFKKEDCKEYKTIEGALKAAEKDGSLKVWDEEGKDCTKHTEATEEYKSEEEKKIAQEVTEETIDTCKEEVIIPQGKMLVTVICEGTLNLRRTASWDVGNECGRAARGQKYYVKAIHIVDGKKMVETIDGIFISGQTEHVQFEQV